MSLQTCPIQEICQKYSNGIKQTDHYIRLTHPCNQFLAMDCEMGIMLEQFITDEPIACDIDKVRRLKAAL